jgi:hypothetical protein
LSFLKALLERDLGEKRKKPREEKLRNLGKKDGTQNLQEIKTACP